jgi:hypothetical protein
MHVIDARNVNDAFRRGLEHLMCYGVPQESRAGKVIVSPTPVTTLYRRPRERVLWHPVRDANPVFHLMEALWMLAGRNDAKWLDQFVGDFSQRFAEEDGHQHGAYGFRWRRHFDVEGQGHPLMPDQLDALVRLLGNDSTDRRVVLTMWDPVADLGAAKRDVPCNTHAYLRVRGSVLDITVCCRSNDAVWGAYGANAVHFSVLQEYLAARLSLGVGCYYQISNNFHVYTQVLAQMGLDRRALEVHSHDLYADGVAAPTRMVTDGATFDNELRRFFEEDTWSYDAEKMRPYNNVFFSEVALPMFWWYKRWRGGEKRLPDFGGTDWSLAAQSWAARRMARASAKENAA